MTQTRICIQLSTIVSEFNDVLMNSEHSTLKLTKSVCKYNDEQYSVIKYDKPYLSADLVSTYGLCRSVVVNKDNQIICFSPPKSIPYDHFMNKQSESEDEVVAQEFVEGTMVNVFWDKNTGIWEIATRNTVGALSCFYNKKTFRDMFMETANSCGLILDDLDTTYCYSFVMQHPDNRIVVPFKIPKLYLIAQYSIENDSDNVTVYSYNIYETQQNAILNTSVEFPKIYDNGTRADLISQYASMNTPYDCVGLVFYNMRTGERTKLRNPVYEEIRSLRGNQPKMQYQYLCLRKEGKVKDYLKFYPENKKDFSVFRDQVHTFTNTLLGNYISCYIRKEKPLIDFSKQYRTHMYNLHQIYLNDLKDKRLFITNTVVINYVNSTHPSLLIYGLNFNNRQRRVDIIRSETQTSEA